MGKLDNAFSSLFETNMGISSGERVLVFSDIVRSDENLPEKELDRRLRLHCTARDAASFAMKKWGSGLFVEFPSVAASGVEPPETLWRATFGERCLEALKEGGLLTRLLLKKTSPDDMVRAAEIVTANRVDAVEIIIAMSNNSTSHTRYRALANLAGSRFASLPHFDPEMFHTSMAVDWKALKERTARLVEAINSADWIRVTSPNGTDMMICKEGRFAGGDDGDLTLPGSFGNLPAGEGYFAPLEGKSHGVMVIEWSPVRRLDKPLVLEVENGVVVRIGGEDPYRLKLEEKFAQDPNCRNMAELGIGTNDRASRPDNVLEAEKILGTVHMALGDNRGFGGITSAPFHEDYVFYRPTLSAVENDGSLRVIIDDGKLL